MFPVAVDERESSEVLSILKWMQLIQPLGILGVPAGAFSRSLVVGFALWLSSWVCFFFEEAPSPHLSLTYNPQEVMCGLACPLLAKPLGDRPFMDGRSALPSPSVTALVALQCDRYCYICLLLQTVGPPGEGARCSHLRSLAPSVGPAHRRDAW